jgi:hypothetical protein
MKNSIIYFVALTVLLVSCKKTNEPFVTSFQLEVTDYFTGDSMPNFPFKFSGVYSSSYNFDDVTNDYGRFDTIFTHEQETNFDCLPLSTYDYLIGKTTGQVIGGANTEVKLELVSFANFSYFFNCSFGSGYIQNVQREFLYPFTPDPGVQSAWQAQTQSIASPTCGSNMNAAAVISGTWIVTYQKKTSAGAPWVDYTDTVTVAPGESYMHTIDY